MKALLVAAGIGLAMLSPARADDEAVTCKSTSTEDVASLFDRWNASLKTLKPEEVVKNYEEDAILLPTVSNKPRVTQDERRDYFEHFLEKKPVGKIDMRVIKIGCNNAIDAGIYTFTFGDGSKVQARYTFTYELKNGTWLISSHHSSAMPETAQ
ncbi:MAG: SgcJ/EcaC family oxidoreductase [Methylobacteriaceae bacterium]|nr:SgcJ/EcaC family oxidoreductase [Methylobacteriaceae bacterium]